MKPLDADPKGGATRFRKADAAWLRTEDSFMIYNGLWLCSVLNSIEQYGSRSALKETPPAVWHMATEGLGQLCVWQGSTSPVKWCHWQFLHEGNCSTNRHYWCLLESVYSLTPGVARASNRQPVLRKALLTAQNAFPRGKIAQNE